VKGEAITMVQVAYGLIPPPALLGGDGETPVDDGSFTKAEVTRLLADFQFIRGPFGTVRIIFCNLHTAQL
jgi:hypothetical protein